MYFTGLLIYDFFPWIICLFARHVYNVCEMSSYFTVLLFVVLVFLNCCSSRYIVYDVAQIYMKYLVKIKFNYQTSLWWEGLRPDPPQ